MEAVKAKLKDMDALRQHAQQAFYMTDTDRSGYIEEGELHSALQGLAKALKAPLPTRSDVLDYLRTMDTDRDGKVSFEEFVKLIVVVLKKFAGLPLDEENSTVVGQRPAKPIQNKQLRASPSVIMSFAEIDRRLETAGLKAAFKLIFAEVYTQQLDSGEVFKYTASRLKQIGKDAANYR